MTLQYRIEPERRRPRLKAELAANGWGRLMEVHSGLSGMVANSARLALADGTSKEFDGLWLSSFTTAALKGLPDAEIVSLEARLDLLDEILFVTDKPVVVDADTGLDATHFEYTCAKLETRGVSAVIIEDKRFPKRNSLAPTASQTLEAPEAFAAKIRRGKSVLRSADFMIIARLESLIANQGQADALARAGAYLEAGADGIMIHSRQQEPEEVFAFAEAYGGLCREQGDRKPLFCAPTTYNTVTEATLRARGFNVVIYANHLLRAAHAAMRQTCAAILAYDRSLEAEAGCTPVQTLSDAVGLSEVLRKDHQG